MKFERRGHVEEGGGSRLEGDTVVCVLHGARFVLATGEVLAPPALVAVKTHEVRVEGE